ncbi:MAG: hypothetical protein HYT99_09095, partial [Candidatus Tectomicrobia bacterium]|nr:hypothetical protein [Candidatus Tectomicrobia bacterium]
GAKFHDGTPLDAEAVKWNFDLINGRLETEWMKAEKKKNPKFKFNSSYNLYLYQVKKVEVVDKTTVRLHQQDLGKGMTLPALAGYFTRMVLVSPTAYNRDYEKFKKMPVYGGPFKITEYKHNQLVVMERFKDYYIKDRPYLDRIEIRYMPDANQRLNALRSGEIDVIFNVPLALVATLEKTPGVRLHTGRTASTMGVPINNQRGPWKDVRVRRALGCYGINRALISRTALRGLVTPWASFSGPGARDAIDLTSECPFDPAKAKALLAGAVRHDPPEHRPLLRGHRPGHEDHLRPDGGPDGHPAPGPGHLGEPVRPQAGGGHDHPGHPPHLRLQLGQPHVLFQDLPRLLHDEGPEAGRDGRGVALHHRPQEAD